MGWGDGGRDKHVLGHCEVAEEPDGAHVPVELLLDLWVLHLDHHLAPAVRWRQYRRMNLPDGRRTERLGFDRRLVT